MDFLLALLPITIIRGLNMGLKQKIGLCTLLSLGILYEIGTPSSTSPNTNVDNTEQGSRPP